jgi:glycosyltransferase involved in cell wall biosynthesis
MRVIVLNAEQAEQVVDLYGVDQGHVSIVPNAVADRFRVPPRAGGQSPNRPFRLLSVGRMSPQKNLPRLIEAMAQVQSDVVLTIVGEGPAAAEVEQLITRRGLGNIRMVGAQRGPQLAEWYRWADALVMTSDQEGMPMVLLEAMAAGLPIVATDVSGVGSTLGDAGLLVHPNATAVARGIDRLANDNDFAVELSRRGVARSEMFRWDRVLDLLDDVYETVGKWPL